MSTSLEHFEDSSIVINKFNEESARDFRKKVLRLSHTDPSMPIVVYIDSYGGYVDSLNSMLATMRSVPNQFVTVCIGKAMSCGAALLAAGDFRFCDVGARVMIHELSGGAVGNIDDIKTDAKESDRLNLALMTAIAERCGMTYNQLKQKIKDNEGRDLYLTAEAALKFGIVDFIGLPVIKPVLSYQIEIMQTKTYEPIESAVASIDILEKNDGIKKKSKTDSKKNKTTKKGGKSVRRK